MLQQRARLLQPPRLDKFGGGGGKIFAEQRIQLYARKVEFAAEGVDGKLFFEVLFDIGGKAGVDAAVVVGNERFQVFIPRAGVEDMDGGVDLVFRHGGQPLVQGGKARIRSRKRPLAGADLPDDDIADDLVFIEDGRKALDEPRMAGVGGAAMGRLACGKGAPVAGAALLVHCPVFAQGAAEGGQLFGVKAEFVLFAVVDAHLDARQVVKVVQKLLHLLNVVHFHLRKPKYEIGILFL